MENILHNFLPPSSCHLVMAFYTFQKPKDHTLVELVQIGDYLTFYQKIHYFYFLSPVYATGEKIAFECLPFACQKGYPEIVRFLLSRCPYSQGIDLSREIGQGGSLDIFFQIWLQYWPLDKNTIAQEALKHNHTDLYYYLKEELYYR